MDLTPSQVQALTSNNNKDQATARADAAKSSSRTNVRSDNDSPKNATLDIAKCPLFCCFYAEFDNKVGPVVSYESPLNFMEQRVESPLQQIHSTLKETLTRLQTRTSPETASVASSNNTQTTATKPPQTESSPANHRRHRSNSSFQDIVSSKQYPSRRPEIQGDDNIDDNHDEPVTIKEGSLSIFDSCSEYIITGNELTGNLVNLSTHHFHILSRPTVISDERYERNSLLFAVGFVLRRAEDPRPFRPILSKLALTLRDIEVESHFLSSPTTRPQLQRLLEHVLVSFNSTKPECSLYLNAANYVNLKLFQPPSPPTAPVPDYAVPLLLRRDWQYATTAASEWDLSINWVLLHIDGMANAKQISLQSEVDMEMVRACLRVLKHHGVIACVDMFRFSNRYETTAAAASLLSGHATSGSSTTKESKPSLRQAAVEYCLRRGARGASSSTQAPSEVSGQSPASFSNSPSRMREGSGGNSAGSAGTHRWMTSNDLHQRKEDYNEVKHAIAELYSLFRRDMSIGDLWLGLVAGTILPSSTLNWKRLFGIIDHRRFTSFGIVHGLIRRVHQFPILVDRPLPATTEVSGYIPPPMELVRTMDGISPERNLRSQSTGSNTGRQEHTKVIQSQLATMLDGRHCDDELVTHFERPLEELLDLFAGRRIVSVYSPVTTSSATKTTLMV